MLSRYSKRSLLICFTYLILVLIGYLTNTFITVIILIVGFVLLILPYVKKKYFNITLFYSLLVSLLAICLFILSLHLTPEIRPYISITKIDKYLNTDQLKVSAIIKNSGGVSAKITNIELEFIGENLSEDMKKDIIVEPGGIVKKEFGFSGQEIKNQHIIRIKINYVNPLQAMSRDYCIQYYLGYDGYPDTSIAVKNSTLC